MRSKSLMTGDVLDNLLKMPYIDIISQLVAWYFYGGERGVVFWLSNRLSLVGGIHVSKQL